VFIFFSSAAAAVKRQVKINKKQQHRLSDSQPSKAPTT
jgi:hypothetical protein